MQERHTTHTSAGDSPIGGEAEDEADLGALSARDEKEGEKSSPPVTADDLVSDRALEAAEEDEFNHEALANRVAELVTIAAPPLNVALFGPWGSGKSSIAGFLKQNLEHPDRNESVEFAYYDAWKYGGESLRRNFISRAAAELELPADDPDYEEFYRGLYQTTRRVRLKDQLLKQTVGLGFALLAVLFVALNVVTALGAGALSVVTNEDFLGEIGRVLPKSVAGTGLAAMAAAVATALFALAKFDIEESAPSADEEFSDTFRKLIKTVRRGPSRAPSALWGWNRRRRVAPQEQKSGGPERIVFFIDELDRCTEEDVVKTLVAVRTFLDEKHCVFVVAADRAVLETALDKAAEQETPTSEDAPYYSTAGAFLDKVFQHQLTIPPLRSRRLSRFARDQVGVKKAGIWKELRDNRLLDDVVYALVPAHVRSPRRIKVLLNNFAINARIAQARGVAWPSRAEEMAKLTVLQTEYPALADDLHIEPRLPWLLLEPNSGEAKGERAKPLVSRHSVDMPDTVDDIAPQDATAFIDEDVPEPAPKDPKTPNARHEEMRNRQRRELRRYLERTVDIDGPHRDLLYLEAAGEAVDLQDPALGDKIEDLAPDKPEEVAGLLAGTETSERLGAARLLASMLEDLVRKERANVMTALTTLTVDLGDELTADVAAALAKSIRTFQRPDDLAPSHLPGVLEVALVASDDELAKEVLAENDLWVEPSQVETVALRWGRLPTAGQERLERELARVLGDEPSVITTPLSELPETQALEVLLSPAIRAAINDAYDTGADQLDALVEGLLDAPLSQDLPRATQLDHTLALLRPEHDPTYQLLRKRFSVIAPALPAAERNQGVLRMWAVSPMDDWGLWDELLTSPGKDGAPGPADAVLSRVFREWSDIPFEAEPTVIDEVRKLVPFAQFAKDEGPDFVTSLESAVADRWDPTETSFQSRENLHEAARETLAIRGGTAERVERLLVQDLLGQLDAGATPEMFAAIERMVAPLTLDSIFDVAEHLQRYDPKSQPEESLPELTTRAGLALQVKDRGGPEWRGPATAISYNDEVRPVLGTPGAEPLLTRWLRLEPRATAVRAALRGYSGELSAPLRAAIEDWAEPRRRKDRTLVAKALLKQERANSGLIAAITSTEVTQLELARELAALATEQRSAEQRQTFAEKTKALRLRSPQARQLIADAALNRLRSGVKRDIAVAVALVAGLGEALPRQAALKRAFAEAADQHNYTFSGEDAAALVRSGIKPPKKSLGKKVRKALFGS